MLCYVFFVKQKTSYEMRISDWSSDVCSSDLVVLTDHVGESTIWTVIDSDRDQWRHRYSLVTPGVRAGIVEVAISPEGEMSRINVSYDMTALPNSGDERSDERRVGKECVSTCSSRCSPSH